jgi:hypothetical protein
MKFSIEVDIDLYDASGRRTRSEVLIGEDEIKELAERMALEMHTAVSAAPAQIRIQFE